MIELIAADRFHIATLLSKVLSFGLQADHELSRGMIGHSYCDLRALHCRAIRLFLLVSRSSFCYLPI